jgi:hypothetical protein
MSGGVRAGWLFVVGAVVALVAWALGGPPSLVEGAVLAGALAAGELLWLRPNGRTPLPLAFAVMTVVATMDPVAAVAVVGSAEVVAVLVNPNLRGVLSRVVRLAERLAEAMSAGAAYQIVHTFDFWTLRAADLVALTVAAVAPIVVAEVLDRIRRRPWPALGARSADVAIVTGGILMAVGYQGIAGVGDLGVWGPVLFSVPLLAAWYSFELLASTRRTFEQTVRSLAEAPELGGLVRGGHAARVAVLSTAMGRMLELPQAQLDDLRTAALLHHLGAVSLDEPTDGAALDPAEVARAGAEMLRASGVLAPAGDIVAAERLLHRPPAEVPQPSAALAGMILKVASAYDELTGGDDEHSAWAIEALYTGPGYVYDGRVLDALERVLGRRVDASVR